MCTFRFLLGLYIFIEFIFCSNSENWFGPNQEFKCRCEGATCDADGQCAGGSKCADGWFGYKCQNYDLIKANTTTVHTQPDRGTAWLTDRDNSTCAGQDIVNISIQWDTVYVFTWLRLTVNNESALPNFKLLFSGSKFSAMECLDKRTFLINGKVLDVHCNVPETVRGINITGIGVKFLCSINVNGGRNVALRQFTNQSSTYVVDKVLSINFSLASNAVDGDTNSNFFKQSCTHTNGSDAIPSWTVALPRTEISRYIIYNRGDCCQQRLQKFNLRAYNEANNVIFDYTDAQESVLATYTILDPAGHIASYVEIKGNSTVSLILSLCEVEIYGDCPQGTWGLDCKSWCTSKCSDNCHPDDGSCNLVCFGYSDPPTCKTACVVGTYGLNCMKQCPKNCDTAGCDRNTGLCYHCVAGYYGASCNYECSRGFWGADCVTQCNKNCLNTSCHRQTGVCLDGCTEGFQPPQCSQIKAECYDGYYGANCSLHCPKHCLNRKCYSQHGYCIECNGGFSGDFCDQDFQRIQSNLSMYAYFRGQKLLVDGDGQSSSNELSFEVGVGVGLGVGIAVLVIAALVGFVVYKTRTRKLDGGTETIDLGSRPYEDIQNDATYEHRYDTLNPKNDQIDNLKSGTILNKAQTSHVSDNSTEYENMNNRLADVATYVNKAGNDYQ